MSNSIQKLAVVAVTSALLGGAGSAMAADLMPDFADVPTGWVTDRYDPTSFANVGTFQGRDDVLGIEITSAGGLTNRPAAYQSAFYNTQGRQHTISGGAGSSIEADLYIERSWLTPSLGSVRTDMWGVMTDGAAVTDYPIIGFTNYGGSARYRVWDDDTANGWVDLNTPVAIGWVSFAIAFTGSAYEFSINDLLVYTDSTINGTTGFSAVIMQAYNFGDTSIAGAVPRDYTARWSNDQAVPEPATLVLLGLGLAGLGFSRRRQ